MAEGETSHTKSSQDIFSNVYVWIIGVIILLVAGFFGYQFLLGSTDNYRITLMYSPAEIEVSRGGTFTWKIDGPPVSINHTAVHLGLTSNLGELGKDVKPADTSYSEMVTDFVSGKFDIPLTFTGNIKIDKLGKYYFRVHALIKDKNYWTDEYTLEVVPLKPKVLFITTPDVVDAGSILSITWDVDGPPTTINHTSVHFGTESTPGTLGLDIRPADTKYIHLIGDFTSGKYDIPYRFIGNISIATTGAYFYRGHAVINRENYWTEEKQLTVREASVVSPTEAVLPPEDETPTPERGPSPTPTETP